MAANKSLLEACLETIQLKSFTSAYHNTFKLVEADTDMQRHKAFHLRYKVFCEENSFGDPLGECSYKDQDQYDERSTHFLLQHQVSGETAGTLRVILPNDEQPGESFPIQKLCNHPLLKMDSRALSLCEISRFCMAKRFRKRPGDGQTLSSYFDQDTVKTGKGPLSYIRRTIAYAPAALLQGAFETALNARIVDCVWMVEPAHLPSLNQIGFTYRVLGPRVDYCGGAQPIIFNIKHVLDNIHRRNPACWEVVSDSGRLQIMADELDQNDWQDRLIDEEAWDSLYQGGDFGTEE